MRRDPSDRPAVLPALLGVAAALPLLAGCGETVPAQHRVIGGDPERGLALIDAYGCATCHVVPGVGAPRGTVGPSLEEFGSRNMIAGIIPNLPDQLIAWLRDPPAIAPRTAMPNMGLTTDEARDVAAYLYTLR